MSDFRYRPAGLYIFEAEWQDLYLLTEHWKSDILFYADDLKFLRHLIDKYFIWITKKENIDVVREAEVNLMEADKQCASLLNRIDIHSTHLAELIDDPFRYDSYLFRSEHGTLEDDLTNFRKIVRQNRKDILTITEQVIDSEKFMDKIMSK
jgi:hypothetical protein